MEYTLELGTRSLGINSSSSDLIKENPLDEILKLTLKELPPVPDYIDQQTTKQHQNPYNRILGKESKGGLDFQSLLKMEPNVHLIEVKYFIL